MANYLTEGVIIKSRDFSEADKILTIFTETRGKISVLARGARRTKSKKGPYLDLFNHNVFYLIEGKTFDIITDIKPIKTFEKRKRNLKGISTLYYLAELLDKSTVEGEKSPEVFKLLLETIPAADDSSCLRHYELRLLTILGFRPELLRCVKCLNPLTRVGNRFSAQSGGIICEHCPGEGYCISTDAIKVLRFLSEPSLGKAKKLILDKRAENEVKKILRYYLEWILEKRLKSVEFFEEVSDEK